MKRKPSPMMSAVLALCVGLAACKTQSELPPATDAKHPGTLLMTNGWTQGLTLSAYELGAAADAAPLWTGSKVAAGRELRLSGFPKNKSINFKALDDASPPTNYTLVQDGLAKTFIISSLRSYELGFVPDAVTPATMVWSWMLEADPAYEASSIAVTPATESLVLSWKDPAMADLVSVKIVDANTKLILGTLLPGVEAATLTGLTGGTALNLALYCAYPEIDSRGASASGTPLADVPVTPPPPVPTVSATTPASGAAGVSPAIASIAATFTESMDVSSFTAASFFLKDASGNAVAGTLSVSGKTASLAPSAPGLAYGTTYTATLTTALKSQAGASLAADHSWSFATPPPPLFKDYLPLPGRAGKNAAVAVGDLNGDGRHDIALATSYYATSTSAYTVLVFLQGLTGGFSSPAEYLTADSGFDRPLTIALGDINGDSRKDLIIGKLRGGFDILIQNASGTLDPATHFISQDSSTLTIADLNNDTLDDIAGVDWGNSTASIWYQKADHSMSVAADAILAVKQGGRNGLATGDVSGDGRTDLVVMSGQSLLPNLGILLQTSSGGLSSPLERSPASAYVSTSGVAVGDITGDGLGDIAVSCWDTPGSYIAVFAQGSGGTIPSTPSAVYASKASPGALAIADVNGDGKADVLVSYGSSVGVFLQDSVGGLGAEIQSPIPYSQNRGTQDLATGDLDNDGKADDVVSVTDDGLAVLIKY